MASGQGLMHEGKGIKAGVAGHFSQALHKEAPVLVMPDWQSTLLASRC